MNNDNIYWMFSSAAQTISAFVAFLLTGYALVHSMMESARERDDSLEEIHLALRQRYHRWLTLLAWETGVAIVLSLLMVYLNRWEFNTKSTLILITTIVDLVAILGGLAFVVSIVDPAKYIRAAELVLEDQKEELSLSGAEVAPSAFFDVYRGLERRARQYVRTKNLVLSGEDSDRSPSSLRQCIEALYQNEKIETAFYNEALQICKYRNLIFHGHVKFADQSMIDRVRIARQTLDQLPA